MSRRIARIMSQPEREITQFLEELEEKNGRPSHDARFLARNIQAVRQKTHQLGLDPDDTTAKELYQALKVKFEKSCRLFDIHYGAQEMDFNSKCAKAAELIQNNFDLPLRWALRNPAAKKILRDLPPKRMMKYLNYRSVESLLKREKLPEIYLALAFVEPASWQKAHRRLITRLDQTDFELRQSSITVLNYDKWSDFAGPSEFTAENDEIGTFGLWPSPNLEEASLLNLLLLLHTCLHPAENQSPITKLSAVLEWWSDIEHSLAELGGENVSLNLKDIAADSLKAAQFEVRQLKHARQSFWHQLLSCYQNLPPVEALFDEGVRTEIKQIKRKEPQPALEFAEDFDG